METADKCGENSGTDVPHANKKTSGEYNSEWGKN